MLPFQASLKMQHNFGRRIAFHEDIYCRHEFQLMENAAFLYQECSKIDEFSQEHFDGYGWTSAYVRSESPKHFAERKIRIKDVYRFFQKQKFEVSTNIYSGYGFNLNEPVKSTYTFEKNGLAFFSFYEGKIAKNLWFINFGSINTGMIDDEEFKHILIAIGKKWNLLLVDWDWTVVVNLQSESEVEHYVKGEF